MSKIDRYGGRQNKIERKGQRGRERMKQTDREETEGK